MPDPGVDGGRRRHPSQTGPEVASGSLLQAARPESRCDRHGRCGGNSTPGERPPTHALASGGRSRTAPRLLAPVLALFAVVSAPTSVALAGPPDSEQAVTAWLTADAWVREGRVPPAGSDPAQVALDGVEALSLTLRLDGRVVASGDAEGGDGEMLRRAAGRLLSECAAHLRSRWPESMHDRLRGDALLDVELAGPAEPLLGSTFAQAAASVEPGIDALAVRRGDRWARAFPGRLLAAGLAGDSATSFGRLATETGLPRGASLQDLLELDSVGLYRLPTIRLGQLEPRGLPQTLLRHGPVAASPPMDAAAARELAESLLGHLRRRSHASAGVELSKPAGDGPPTGLGLRGDHDPISGRHEPFVAPPLVQALAVLATTRLAAVDPALQPSASNSARRLFADLARVDPIEVSPFEMPEVLAVVAIAAALDPGLAELDGDAAALVAAARASVAESGRPENFESLSPGRQAIVVAAAATLAARERGRADDGVGVPSPLQTEISERLRTTWAGCDQAIRVGLLPWFAWAATRLPDGGGLAAELDRFRTELADLQIAPVSPTTSDPPIAADLVGGFDLEQGPRPRADARSVLPALGLALMLADETLTPRSAAPSELASLRFAIASQRLALEFLRRSMATREAASRLPHGPNAIGGIRDAPWDAGQSAMVQVLALWWLAERLGSGLP